MVSRRSADTLRILMVAPQPFFRARGTPFSVLHRIRALTSFGHQVDLITYPFGDDVSMPGLSIYRSAKAPFVRDVKIGPSVAKLLLDFPLFCATLSALRTRRYDLVHSHEEAAFFCAPLAKRYGVTHVYDMHSSLPQQLSNFNYLNVGPVRGIFSWLERYVISSSDGVITICQDLADVALPLVTNQPHAMIENTGDDSKIFDDPGTSKEDRIIDLPNRRVILYTGTFESYQGLDLLLEAFALLHRNIPDAHLVLVGGRSAQVEAYKAKASQRQIDAHTTFVGQVPPTRIPAYVNAAELIVSPRSSGTNTPLKIYGYLRSDRPLVATDLYTHTQTLNPEIAELVPPTPQGLAKGMEKILTNPAYGRSLAQAAHRLSDAEYSDEAYLRKVSDFYKKVLARTDHLGSNKTSNDRPKATA